MTQDIINCYCRVCKHETHHTVLFSYNIHSEDSDYWWSQDYMIVKCCGCDSVSFCNAIAEEGDVEYDDQGNEYIPTRYNVIPKPTKLIDTIETTDLPIEIQNIYKETIDCINDGNLILAGAGCRAIIETVCRAQGIAGKQLETMINNLAQKRIITKNDRDHLHAIRFMGNDSIHNAKAFDIKELIIVAKIINTILTSLYTIHNEFKKLKEKPITSFDEFKSVLDKQLDKFQAGETGNLMHFINGVRGLIKDDRQEFENQLVDEINNGTYTRLSILQPLQNSQNKRYQLN